jgi:hypothetical protein
MSAPPAQDPGLTQATERLSKGLERVLSALARGDAEEARAAARDAEDVCAALSASRVRLPPAAAATLAEACARAEKLAAGVLGRVGDELDGAARSRRAADAYGAPTSPHRHLP